MYNNPRKPYYFSRFYVLRIVRFPPENEKFFLKWFSEMSQFSSPRIGSEEGEEDIVLYYNESRWSAANINHVGKALPTWQH